ncbi:hypothetical protein [Ralstonia insidiosa]|uniref:Uncharacterized protein n=1 Tax=Ralstonia insidiosa TaxID=190721 RepID=A0A848P7R1_9RALS|nr:hypothetical protein [Ralstonia insidiosa]NMV40656.1 hypothetical protein [Ralstonia insidiosa]
MDDIVLRRLVLAKEFYENAEKLCTHSDPLSKMMAVHNFHIALEITIKSIILKYEIRSEKTLNIDFESMLNEVDKHKPFSDKGIRIPYRQDIRMLNQKRNLVQHHVAEPEKSSMDDWKSISRRFLENTFRDYFELSFHEINRFSFIKDSRLRKLLEEATRQAAVDELDYASTLLATTYTASVSSLQEKIPNSSSALFFTSGDIRRSGLDGLERAFEKVFKRIDELSLFSAILASGVTIEEYRRLQETMPFVHKFIGGRLSFDKTQRKLFSRSEISWAIEFICGKIIQWQSSGLNPAVPNWLEIGVDEVLNRVSE